MNSLHLKESTKNPQGTCDAMNYNYFFVKVPILRNKHYGLNGLVLYRIKTVQSGGKQSSHSSEYQKILFCLDSP